MSQTINYNWKYASKFEPVFDWKGRYILLTGGRASGKSWYVAHLMLERLMYQSADLLCVRETQKSIGDSAYKTLKNIIDKYKLPYEVQNTKIISKITGSTIVFIGLSNVTAENVKSYENFKYVWIEEAQSIESRSWENLNPTIRTEGAQIFVTMNPEVPLEKHPITNELTGMYKDETLHLHINYYDNPFVNKAIIKMAESVKINQPEKYRRVWEGYPDGSLGNLIVKGFSKDNIRPLFYQPKLDLHISCDFNYDPMCWVMFHKTQEKMYVFDELIEERTSTLECARRIIDRYPEHLGGIVINGDASGMQRNCAHSNPDMTNFFIIQRELENYYHRPVDIEIRRGNPHKIKRFEAFNNMVKRYDGEICFYIDPKCKWTIYNIENAKFKEGTREVDEPTASAIQRDPKLKFMIHPLDAASYPCEYYWEVV